MRLKSGKIKFYRLKNARSDLPTRLVIDNKTRGGKSLVVAGSDRMWGAAVLCAQATARIGAGYTYILNNSKKFPNYLHPDFLIAGKINKLSDFRVIALGPGYKNTRFLKKLIKRLIAEDHQRVVLDAEALNALTRLKKLDKLPANWILTPHEGEASKLLNISSTKIRRDRLYYLQQIQKKFGCIVVLKGHHTLVADGKGVYQIDSGNPALAKAGTGDVLTGMITGLLSQNLPPIAAACCGTFIHGYISDIWIKDNDILSLLASDIIAMLPPALKKIRSHRN